MWACAAYLVAFALPVFDGGHQNHMSVSPSGPVFGYRAFLLSILGLAGGMPAWLANPLFWFAMFNYSKGRFGRACFCSALAFFVGLTALIFLCDPGTVPAWRDGYSVWLTSFYGYYVWMLSFVLLAAANFRRSGVTVHEVVAKFSRLLTLYAAIGAGIGLAVPLLLPLFGGPEESPRLALMTVPVGLIAGAIAGNLRKRIRKE